MDSALVASTTDAFVEEFQTILGTNFGKILIFTAGILVWMIIKKWFFGGVSRV